MVLDSLVATLPEGWGLQPDESYLCTIDTYGDPGKGLLLLSYPDHLYIFSVVEVEISCY